jgi:hypothetical protein
MCLWNIITYFWPVHINKFYREQPSLPIIRLSSSTASSNEKYTCGKIQHLLKYEKTQGVVLEDLNNKKSSVRWGSFDFSTKLDLNDTPEKNEGFVVCKSCLLLIRISNSTYFLKKYNCKSSQWKINSTLFSSQTASSSQSLITVYDHPKRQTNIGSAQLNVFFGNLFIQLEFHWLSMIFIRVYFNNDFYKNCFYLCDYICF